jgi:hypothetical protein
MTSLLRELVPVPMALARSSTIGLEAAARQRAANRQADHAGSDHHRIDAVHRESCSLLLLRKSKRPGGCPAVNVVLAGSA